MEGSEEVRGIDTITGLVGEPPGIIEVPYRTVKEETILQQSWNSCHIAIIPYCYKCKEPLIWLSPPKEDRSIFKCPKCERCWKHGSKDGK